MPVSHKLKWNLANFRKFKCCCERNLDHFHFLQFWYLKTSFGKSNYIFRKKKEFCFCDFLFSFMSFSSCLTENMDPISPIFRFSWILVQKLFFIRNSKLKMGNFENLCSNNILVKIAIEHISWPRIVNWKYFMTPYNWAEIFHDPVNPHRPGPHILSDRSLSEFYPPHPYASSDNKLW